MTRCEQCGQEYEAKRKTSRFCGSTCRSAYNRGTVARETLTPGDATLESNCNDTGKLTLHTEHNQISVAQLPVAIDVQAVDSSAYYNRDCALKSLGSPTYKDDIEATVLAVCGQDPIACQHVLQAKGRAGGGKNEINIGSYMDASELSQCKGSVVNRVALPGDSDYTGVAVI